MHNEEQSCLNLIRHQPHADNRKTQRVNHTHAIHSDNGVTDTRRTKATEKGSGKHTYSLPVYMAFQKFLPLFVKT